MRILGLAGRRLAASIPTLILILIGVFLLLQFAPGDTVDAMMAQMGGGDAATAKELRKFYGLDVSIAAQLGNYLWRLVRLDLGFSSIYGKPVASVILERLPPTILLMTASLSFAFFFGLLFGVIAARGVNRWPDTLISTRALPKGKELSTSPRVMSPSSMVARIPPALMIAKAALSLLFWRYSSMASAMKSPRRHSCSWQVVWSNSTSVVPMTSEANSSKGTLHSSI